MSENELIWLAGLLEAEGSFQHGPPSSHRSPQVSVSMTDADVIDRVAVLFGIEYKLFRRFGAAKGWKPLWNVKLNGSRAVALMRDLLPYMGVRRSARIRDVVARYEAMRAELPVPILSRDLADRIRKRWAAKELSRGDLAREYGVSYNTIYRATTTKTTRAA